MRGVTVPKTRLTPVAVAISLSASIRLAGLPSSSTTKPLETINCCDVLASALIVVAFRRISKLVLAVLH